MGVNALNGSVNNDENKSVYEADPSGVLDLDSFPIDDTNTTLTW